MKIIKFEFNKSPKSCMWGCLVKIPGQLFPVILGYGSSMTLAARNAFKRFSYIVNLQNRI